MPCNIIITQQTALIEASYTSVWPPREYISPTGFQIRDDRAGLYLQVCGVTDGIGVASRANKEKSARVVGGRK